MNLKIRHKKSLLKKLCVEFGPIILFVVVFETHGFFTATFTMILSVILSTLYLHITEKVIPLFTVIVSFTTLVFAVLTIFFQNPKILIFRDTFHDYFFAAAIFFGLYYKKFFLKKLFSHVADFTDRGWKVMSYVWGGYFLITGSINELIREYGSTRLWIDFKITVIFITLALVGLLAFYLRGERIINNTKSL